MKQEVKTIADSMSPSGKRITTFEITVQRFIVEELLKHRMHSHSQTSGRAIPVGRINDDIIKGCAKPEWYTKHQAGMTGAEFDGGYPKIGVAQRTPDEIYQDLANISCMYAHQMFEAGYSKESTSRLTQSFQWARCVITATEWDNFFMLRLAKNTDPTIRMLARRMKDAMEESVPKDLPYGHWHLPYITEDEIVECRNATGKHPITLSDLQLASAARCARVSYNNHDSSQADIWKDVALAKRLITDKHWTPFEHQAFPLLPDTVQEIIKVDDSNGLSDFVIKEQEVPVDNFRGWCSQRAMLRINNLWEA